MSEKREEFVVKPHMDNKDEIKVVSSILEKMGLTFVPRLIIKQNGKDETDVDLFCVYEDLILFVECAGKTNSFGNKFKKTKSNFEILERNFELIAKSLTELIKKENIEQKEKAIFERIIKKINKRDHKSFLIKKIIVTSDRVNNKEKEKDDIYIMDFDDLKYFEKLADITFSHARYELFFLLGVFPSKIGERLGIKGGNVIDAEVIEKKNHRDLIIFSLCPYDLLKITHIRRLYGWNVEGFQRLLIKKKIRSMVNSLKKYRDIYPNNIIVASHEDNFASYKEISDSKIRISFKDQYDVFVLIDGQHRLFSFSYPDRDIEELSKEKKIIVTAMIYRKTKGINGAISEMAKLFYEINTTYTKLNPEEEIDLKTKLPIYQHDPIADANRLIKELNKEEPLRKKIKVRPFDEDYLERALLKRVSLIRYGELKDIFSKESRTYKIYDKLFEGQKTFKDYFQFCKWIVNLFFKSVRESTKSINGEKLCNEMWSDTEREKYYFMTVTVLGAMIRLLRHFLSERDKEFAKIRKIMSDHSLYIEKKEKEITRQFEKGMKIIFKKLKFTTNEWEKKGYKSSQWALLERDMVSLIQNGGFKRFGDISLIPKNLRN